MAQIGKSVKQFLGFGKEGEGIEKTLASYGLNFIKDEKLAWRISELEANLTVIYDTKDVDKQIEIVDKLILTVAMPWGRGGDDPGFSMMFTGWQLLMIHWERYKALRNINLKESFFAKQRRDELLDAYGRKNVLRFGFLVIDRSFYGRDVTPANLAMIQSAAPQAGGGIQPFYKSKYGEGAGGGKTRET